MKRFFALGIYAFICATSVLAADVIVPPGEEPVEPYVQSNANAGANTLPDTHTFKAFHGVEGIARVVDKTVDLAVADPRMSDIFKGHDLVRLRRTLKEQFCYLLAGPCEYTGRDMKTSHKDMGLQTRDLNLLIEHLREAMRDEKVPNASQNRLLGLLAPMHRDIVER